VGILVRAHKGLFRGTAGNPGIRCRRSGHASAKEPAAQGRRKTDCAIYSVLYFPFCRRSLIATQPPCGRRCWVAETLRPWKKPASGPERPTSSLRTVLIRSGSARRSRPTGRCNGIGGLPRFAEAAALAGSLAEEFPMFTGSLMRHAEFEPSKVWREYSHLTSATQNCCAIVF
jgi:hypothetical protein